MFNESIKMAIDGMISNKLRTLLTLLGIIIGVGAVIAMVSLGFGVKEQVKNNISSLGSNLLIVMSGGRTASGARLAAGQGARLTAEDAYAIEKQIEGIAYIAPAVSSSYQLVVGNQNWTASVEGTTPNVLDIRSYKLAEGRNMTERDLSSRARVCVIGQTIVDNLFPEGDAVGKTLRINKAPFQVIGVLEAKGQSAGGQDQDDVVYIPLTTAQNRMMGITHINRITIQAENENVIDQVQGEVEQLLRQRHKIKAGDDDDFTVRNLAALMETMMETANTITLLLGCIAAISLLVGGIGIMNIMLVAVTERTREIGVRLAIGATAREVLMQFLIEAVVLGCMGGVIGILLATGSSYLITGWMDVPYTFDPMINIVSFAFAALTGVIFGYFPARRAARLDPIEAVRHE